MSKERVDQLVVQQGLAPSREQAKRLVMAGQIYDANNQRYDKPGTKIPAQTQLHLKGEKLPYVSRGGLKLAKAIEVFDLDLKDHILLDIGASTGGFTDCALQNGVKRSYALDVGYNQLDYRLRQDPRVVVMERQNFRYATPDLFDQGQPTMASIDVSFISLDLIMPPLVDILRPGGPVVALIKPQFEAGRERIGKRGLVKDPAVHVQVLQEVLSKMADLGYHLQGLTYSPITGASTGNIEFLALLTNDQSPGPSPDQAILEAVVQEAHQALR